MLNMKHSLKSQKVIFIVSNNPEQQNKLIIWN